MLGQFVRKISQIIVNWLLLRTKNSQVLCIIIQFYKLCHPYLDSNVRFIINDLSNNVFDNEVCLRITNTGLIQVHTDNWIYLYSGGSKSQFALEENSKHYSRLKNSKAKQLVDYVIENKFTTGAVCRVERLFPLIEQEHTSAKRVVLSFFANNSNNISSNYIKSLSEIVEVISSSLNIDLFYLIDKYDLNSIDIVFGFSHGDLTPNNIMKNSKGNFVLIDLDRFSVNRELTFDEIHFDIEQVAASSNWLEALKNRIAMIKNGNPNKYEQELSVHIFYFLRRLSLEFEGPNECVNSYRKKILSFISHI